tara:strand:+ start:396 stop:527 length:132 start_codon:yes stop_codon:yes gene_type:complete
LFDVDEGEKVVSVALLRESDDEQDEENTEVVIENKDYGNEVEN